MTSSLSLITNKQIFNETTDFNIWQNMSFFQKSLRITSLIGSGAGSLLTLIQTILLLFHQETICFNDGCKIVETMTTVPPLIFNLAGLLFFQALFWTFYFTKLKDSYWPVVSRILLFAGLAAEGVLFGYQYFVVEVFCSYCLVILGVVVFLNVLQGIKQVFIGIAVFLAIQIGFASLNFHDAVPQEGFSLDKGVFSTLSAPQQDKHYYLFFSSTCAHCEEVIESLKESPRYPISFNPVDKVEQVNLAFDYPKDDYQSSINVAFLNNFDIHQVPVLLVKDKDDFMLIRGKDQIIETLQSNCYPKQDVISGSSAVEFTLPDQPVDDQNCDIGVECTQ